jgi:predicted nucleic acid-binding protein
MNAGRGIVCTMTKVFFDTNILVYAHNTGEGQKNTIARALFVSHGHNHEVALSTQVIQEFWVTMTKKLGVDKEQIRSQVESLMGTQLQIVQPLDILNAIHWQMQWKISFWDALILVSAKRAGAAVLYTEDLSHGRLYNGVKAVNPFLPLGN